MNDIAPAPRQHWDPSLYAARAAFVPRLASDLVDLLDPKPGERVLDLGAGTGELGARIAARGATVTGLDASAEMLERARAAHPEIEWVVGDGQTLTYRARFDAVFSNAALHWMTDAERVAEGIHAALVPGGRFVAEFGGRGCVGIVRRVASDVLREMGHDPGVWFRWYFPSLAEYAGLLERAGFDVRSAWLFERPTPLDLEDWFALFCAPLLAHLGADRERLLREVEARTAGALRRDGEWILDYVRIRVVARRPAPARAGAQELAS